MTSTTTVTKAPNYSEAQVAEMDTEYTANPTRETVDELAERYGKSPRSIIAKLSNMNIYVAPARTTKAGTPIVKKETLLEDIGALLEVSMPSLVKANKADLNKLLAAVEEWTGSIEDGADLVV